MSKVRHTPLPGLSSVAVMQQMQQARYGTDEVLVRLIGNDAASLRRVLSTGTDRTDASSVFTQASGQYCRGNDASPEARARAGITPGRVTYAFRMNLNEPTPTLRWGGLTGADYPAMAEPLKTLLEGVRASANHTIMLVYSVAHMRRAPDAEVEYWIDGDPAAALLHVFSPLPEDRYGDMSLEKGTHAGSVACSGRANVFS